MRIPPRLRPLLCFLRGHDPTARHPVFSFWVGPDYREEGTVHCKRCGKYLGTYDGEMMTIGRAR